MKFLHITLALAGLVSAAGCAGMSNSLADPKEGFASFTVHGTLERVSGDLEGVRSSSTTGQPVPGGVPYTEQLYAAGAELALLPDETSVLGNSMGMLFGVRAGWVGDATIDAPDMTAPEQSLPLMASFTAGALATVVRRRGLLIALHGSFDLAMSPERLGDTRESWLAIYGGVRGYVDAGPARVRLTYDLMPFWSGESRLEHRIGALLARRAPGVIGVRAALAVGQNRLAAGGLNDTSLTIGVEVGL